MTSEAQALDALRAHAACQAEAIVQLQAALAPRESFAAVGHFSPSETVILSAILKWEVATFEQILQALYAGRPTDPPGPQGVAVMTHRVRCKLAGHGICVWSVRGVGYRMPAESKARLRGLMAGAG